MVNFAGHFSDRIKISAGHNKILLVLSGRPAFFIKTIKQKVIVRQDLI